MKEQNKYAFTTVLYVHRCLLLQYRTCQMRPAELSFLPWNVKRVAAILVGNPVQMVVMVNLTAHFIQIVVNETFEERV